MKSNVFIISGPSGSGQDSVIEGLKKYFEIERIITTTTREPREGESQGDPYYFISKEEFENGIKEGRFAEYANHYNENFYGVAKDELERVNRSGKIGIWRIDYKGVESVKKMYPKIVSILISVSDLKILADRIRKRDDVGDEYVKERMKYTEEFMKHTDIYDHIVYNEEGKLDETTKEVAEIIKNDVDKHEKSD